MSHADRVRERLTSKYTNLCNPLGSDGPNLPMLLRRFADHLEAEGISNNDILHVVVGDEMTEYGSWWDITVYYDDSQPVDDDNVE
jgi:hypothetical protein